MTRMFSYLDGDIVVTLKGDVKKQITDKDFAKFFMELENIDLTLTDIDINELKKYFLNAIRNNGVLSFKELYNFLNSHNESTNTRILNECIKLLNHFNFEVEERYTKEEVGQMFRMRNLPMFSKPSPEFENEINSMDYRNLEYNTYILHTMSYVPSTQKKLRRYS